MLRSHSVTLFCCFLILCAGFSSVSSHGRAVLTSSDCVGRCGQGSNQTSCACDSKCKIYDDCCSDFDQECSNETTALEEFFRTNQSGDYDIYKSCVTLVGDANVDKWFPQKFMMVSTCPQTWNNDLVREKCAANDTLNVLNFLPVHNDDGVLFKNSYCAFCHDVSVDDMLPWQVVGLMNGSTYKVLPPRNIWGSKYQFCEEGFFFFKTCPDEANFTSAEKCETIMKPKLYENTLGYKNDECRLCHNHPVLPSSIAIDSRVTFDVLFGVQSWSALTSNCRNNREIDVREIFQNACPLLDVLREMEDAKHITFTPSVMDHNPTDCVSNFLSKAFQTSQQFYSVHHKLLPGNSQPFVNIYLPNDLSALYLQNIVKNNIATPECNVTLAVNLNASNCRSVEEQKVDFNNKSLYIFDVECTPSSCTLAHHQKITCTKILTCHWENEDLSPIDFKIRNFATMEITHINTGASLTEQEYTISSRGSIQTCSEFLVGPWINVAYYIQIVCGTLSQICILCVIAVHVVFPKLRNIYGFCMVSLLSMLWVALFLLIISTLTQMVDGLAQFISFLGHYAWLSAFAWMTVISFHVSHTFSGKFVANKMSKISSRTDFIFFSLFGWGIPLPFVITAVILHLCDCTDFHYSRHWMSRSVPSYVVFAVPAGLLALTTTCLFFVGMTKLRQRQAKPSNSENKRITTMHNYLVALRLFFIVGVPWILLIVYMAYRNRVLLPILTLINSLQGFFIFLSFVSTKRVRSLMKDRLDQSRQTTTAYSKAKTTAQTDTGTPENTPKITRQKVTPTSAAGEEL